MRSGGLEGLRLHDDATKMETTLLSTVVTSTDKVSQDFLPECQDHHLLRTKRGQSTMPPASNTSRELILRSPQPTRQSSQTSQHHCHCNLLYPGAIAFASELNTSQRPRARRHQMLQIWPYPPMQPPVPCETQPVCSCC
jgi:hypothetical protein